MTTPPGDAPRPDGQPDHGHAPGYGQPVYQPGALAPWQGGYGPPVGLDHPKASLSLVLGIIGLVACQVVSPFAWAMGRQTVAEIDASGGRLGGRTSAQAGYVLGIVGTALLAIAVLVLVTWLAIILVVIGTTAVSST